MRGVVQSILAVIMIVGMFLLFLDCATIIHGTKQNVSIDSNPPQAEVIVQTTGGVVYSSGKTPLSVRLKRKQEYDVIIKLAGYQDARVHISKDFDPWVIGNLLCGGVIGLIVDAVGGGMWQLEPETIYVTLATAFKDKHKPEIYAVFYALDSEGQLRSLMVPLTKL